MPRKKRLTLEESYQFTAEAYVPQVSPADLFEPGYIRPAARDREPPPPKPSRKGEPKLYRVELQAAHTVGSGGQVKKGPDGQASLQGDGVQTYGPGVVYVPSELAQHLSHQDMLAVRQDQRTFDPHPRYHVIGFVRAPNGGEMLVSRDVTDSPDFVNDGRDLVHFGMYGRGRF